jgi:hypothetical protein
MLVIRLVGPLDFRRETWTKSGWDNRYAVVGSGSPDELKTDLSPDVVVSSADVDVATCDAVVGRVELGPRLRDVDALLTPPRQFAADTRSLRLMGSVPVELRTRTVLRDTESLRLSEQERALFAWTDGGMSSCPLVEWMCADRERYATLRSGGSMRTLLSLLVLTLGSTAQAGDVTVTHQGRLLNSLGGSISGEHEVTLTLYSDASRTSVVWTDVFANVPLTDGYFSVVLGNDPSNRLTSAMLAGVDAHLGVAVDADAELGLSPVGSLGSGAAAIPIHASCQAHLEAGNTESGMYTVDIDGGGYLVPFHVFCDQDSSGGGWMRFELIHRHWGNSLGEDFSPVPYSSVASRLGGAGSQGALNDLTSCSGDSEVLPRWGVEGRELANAEVLKVNEITTAGWTGTYEICDGEGGSDWDQLKGCASGVVVMTADGDEFDIGLDKEWVGPYSVDTFSALFTSGYYGGNADESGYNASLPRYWYLR